MKKNLTLGDVIKMKKIHGILIAVLFTYIFVGGGVFFN